MPDNVDPNGITLALALTAGGAVVFAGLIFGFIEIFKRVAERFVSGKEQLFALLLAGIVVIAAYWSQVDAGILKISIDSVFFGVLAWYGIARASMAIHDDVTRTKGDPLGGVTTGGPAG